MRYVLYALAFTCLAVLCPLGQQPTGNHGASSTPSNRSHPEAIVNKERNEPAYSPALGVPLPKEAEAPATINAYNYKKEINYISRQDDEGKLARYTFWLMIFNGLMVLVTGLLARIAWKQWRTSEAHKKSFEQMETWMGESVKLSVQLTAATTSLSEIQKDEHRAWVDILDVRDSIEMSGDPDAIATDAKHMGTISYKIRNSGVMPACIYKHSCWLADRDDPSKITAPRAVSRNKRILARGEATPEREEFCLDGIEDWEFFLVNKTLHIEILYYYAPTQGAGEKVRTEKVLGFNKITGRFYEDGSEVT